MAELVSFFANMIAVPASWFVAILEGAGMTQFFLAIFMVCMVIKMLLVPVLGQAGSDRASRSRDKEE